MRVALPWTALLVLACASVRAPEDEAGARRAGPSSPLTPLVLWREAERRRDPAEAALVLHLPDAAARRALEQHLAALADVPAGPVRAEIEFHLVQGPAPWGEELYLALEPDGSGHACVRYSLAARPDGVRLVLEAPPWEGAHLDPAARAQAALAAERARWSGLRGKALEREVERLRWTLAGLDRARLVAAERELRVQPFVPDPVELLNELEPLTPPQVRERMLAWLGPPG